MGRAKRFGAGTARGGLAIEYIRTRKVVRLVGWFGEEVIDPVEIPVDELCTRLGIDPRDIVAPHRFLLFAGSHRRPVGGRKDLVGTYDSEEKAWAAFRGLRQSHPALQGWGELAAIDGSGQVTQLAWFGLDTPDGAAIDAVAAPGGKRARRRLAAGGSVADEAAAAPYLRAVTPS